MQLVAYGAQDVYLTGNPQITLFKVVYRRHTNFSSECIELPIETAKPNGRVSVQVLRNGDLATKAQLRLTTPELTPTNSSTYNGNVAWVKRLGHAMIKHVEVQIGGSPIDKHYGVWLDIWYELTHTAGQERGYDAMVGDVDELTTLASSVASGYVLFVPLQFWFCKNYGLALPLIALQYHEVRINLEFESIENLVVYTSGSGSDSAPKFNGLAFGSSGILVDYVYLDSEERRRFAQVGHEYLIEQVQYNEANLQSGSTNQSFTLNFNHPCKELIFTHRVGAFNGYSSDAKFLAYTNKNEDQTWTDALTTAAERLASSMVVRTTTAAGADVANFTRVDVTATGVYSVETSTGALFRFTVVEYAGAASESVYVRNNPLVSGSFNMASKLQTVSVDLKIGATATASNVTVVAVNVTDHTLNLYDVSAPLSGFTDNRVSGTTDNDVHVVQLNNYGLRLDGRGNLVAEGNLVLNGHDRFAKREGNYFNYVQPNQHHTRTPADGINVYSFGLHPEQHQPTGTANMSRIDSARLIYKVADAFSAKRSTTFDLYSGTTVYIFVTNYNVLRIMSGMGGLAYSN